MAEKPWGAVFADRTDPRVEKFTESVSFDRRLYGQDIAGSMAHARMLAAVGLISRDECAQIEQTLRDIRQEIEQGQFPFRTELEDIHMHIERALVDRLGDVGRKLHTARSRNDQVATDLRLWVREAIDRIDVQLAELKQAWVERAERDIDCVLPAYTHMQRAQPVLAAHYWLAYVEKFDRDRSRLASCRARTNVLSLGAAAVAGTSLPIDRLSVARELRVRRRGGQQHRRVERSRFSDRVRLLPEPDRDPSEPLGRGMDFVVDQRVSVSPLAAGVLHRLVDHAAEGQSRRAGVGPRQDRPRDRRPDDTVDAGQGFAAGLQPRLARGQAAPVRRVRHGQQLPGDRRSADRRGPS